MTLVTHQTGPEGRVVRRLLIEETLPIEKELYLGIVIDRAAGPAGIHGVRRGRHGDRAGRGGESRGHSARSTLIPAWAWKPFQARKLAFALGLKPQQINPAVQFMTGLYKAFAETDASLVEINPFISLQRRPACSRSMPR